MRKRSTFGTVIGLLVVLMTGGTKTMAEAGTILENLKQCAFNTTMMGVVMGASNYYQLKLNEEMIYGLSGHAFLINIDPKLCPSDPYTWKIEESLPLIENLGLRMTDLGFYAEDGKSEERAAVERKLRNALDTGAPCSLLNMEHQIISGYDGAGFLLGEPWGPGKGVTPGRLSFGSWKEFGKEVHASFYTIERVQPAERKAAILASLDYAVDMWKSPAKHSPDGSGVGPLAYDNWIKAVPECGAGHGNWWNAMVWSECRREAAGYFQAIATDNKDMGDLCTQLKTDYLKIAENLNKASNKAMAPDEKIALLKEAKKLEAGAIGRVEKLSAALRGAPDEGLKDVRVIYVPPMTVAASHAIGENCEEAASKALNGFVKESGLLKIKPDARHFGFDCSAGKAGVGEPSHAYEMWVSIPDDMTVPAPLIKRKFDGGLYAAHAIKMGDFDHWIMLREWVRNNGKYIHDYDSRRWIPFEAGMDAGLEEQLNFLNNVQNPNFNNVDMQLDLLFPIKEKTQ